MKKIFSILFILSFVSVFAFSFGNSFHGQGKVFVKATEFLDVIYSESSVESAGIIVQNGDQVYREVCADFGLDVPFRICVVVTRNTDVCNAYQSMVGKNHIVLLDTVPDEDLAVFSDTFLEIFRHELAHNVSLNLKEGFFEGLTAVFGDAASWASLWGTSKFMTEGTAVAEESLGGQGRLNDPFYMSTLTQLKLNGNFPSWADVQGATDVYPAGVLPYLVGGAFFRYLQNKYGMEKYARLWWDTVNMKALDWTVAFRNVYGISVNREWPMFVDSIPVPQNLGPEGESVFGHGEGRRIFYLTRGSAVVCFYDGASRTVYRGSLDEEGNLGGIKKLFYMANVSGLGLSSDGKILSIDYYDVNHECVKSQLAFYNLETGKFARDKETGLRSSTAVYRNLHSDEYLVAAVKTYGQNFFLNYYSLDPVTLKKTFLSSKSFPRSMQIFSPVDLGFGDGSVAFILKDGMDWSVVLNNPVDTEKFLKMSAGDGMRLRNLTVSSVDENRMSIGFSWGVQNGFPADGFISIGRDTVEKLCSGDVQDQMGPTGDFVDAFFCQQSFDGAMKECVNVFDSDGNLKNVCSVKDSVWHSELVCNSGMDMEFGQLQLLIEEFGFAMEPACDEKIIEGSEPVVFPYLSRGTLVPLALVPFKIPSVPFFSGTNMPLVLGATYFTLTPWDSNLIYLTAGVSPLSGYYGLSFQFQDMAETSVYGYIFEGNVIFSGLKFVQAFLDGDFSTGWKIGRTGSVSVTESNEIYYGRLANRFAGENLVDGLLNGIFAPGMKPAFSSELLLRDSNSLSIGLTASGKTGPGFREVFIVRGGLSLDSSWNWLQSGNDLQYSYTYCNVSPSLTINIPKLLPLKSRYGWTYNLPLTLNASLYPDYGLVFKGQAFTVLLEKEIQKGLSFFPLYFVSASVQASYTGVLKNENCGAFFPIFGIANDFGPGSGSVYVDSVQLNAVLKFKINQGYFVSMDSFKMTTGIIYLPRTDKNPVRFNFYFSL